MPAPAPMRARCGSEQEGGEAGPRAEGVAHAVLLFCRGQAERCRARQDRSVMTMSVRPPAARHTPPGCRRMRTSVRCAGSPRPARANDWRRPVSWLAKEGDRPALLPPPRRCGAASSSGLRHELLAYSCGGGRGSGRKALTPFPFQPSRATDATNERAPVVSVPQPLDRSRDAIPVRR